MEILQKPATFSVETRNVKILNYNNKKIMCIRLFSKNRK
jgi:hypothetical protein